MLKIVVMGHMHPGCVLVTALHASQGYEMNIISLNQQRNK